jgi:hypothetical protein
MKYKLLILISFFVLTACVNTHKDIFVSDVTIENLKKILVNQTCHNKAIFIFDSACPTCMLYLRKEYVSMQNKFLDSIDYVFISIDTIQSEKYKKGFHTIGIKAGCLFLLHEYNPDYLQANGKVNISKIIQYLFSNEENTYIIGFPISAMVNKENKLKLEYYHMDDSNTIIRPQPWHRLYLSNLSEMDFNVIDSCTN